MPGNPRFALMLARYAQYDRLTLILAALALAAVLLAWAYQGKPQAVYPLILILWLLALAGSAFLTL